jgi:16S rRNA (guanine966-N2)-methyltransferase
VRIISGLRRGMKLSAPSGLETRPVLDRVKRSWFDVLGCRIEGARVLDVYCGVGSLGLEALSRGARHCVFVERSADSHRLLAAHLEKARFGDRATAVTASARTALDAMRARGELFDCIFLDPPFALAAEGPFYEPGGILASCGALLAPEGILMLRREEAGGGRLLEPGCEMLDLLRVSDCRRWGRNEVVFLERTRSEG